MPTHSPEAELLAAVYTLLSTDTELTTGTGIDPATGSARSVAVYNQPPQDTPVPYVRITMTDAMEMEGETYGFGHVPTCQTVSMMIDAISDYEPEAYAVSARIRELLSNAAVTTTHFTGSSWVTARVFTTDNTSSPDHVYQLGSTRVRVNLEPL